MDELIDGMQNLMIECEMPDNKRPRFRTRYHDAAGHAPNEAFMQTQNNKWGVEYRMYFDAPAAVVDGLRDAGLNVEARTTGYGAERAYRINNEELFWELIARGWHLGLN
ncbi:hypothetical protein [Cypionkella sp. TWP1-2-1b2]|uniref:hypothetical protein n=1 Tax=Cypionkella sp. TWP1-2-1b2 TaxID=2804675 RepID=UPI003CE79FDE